MFGSSIVFDCRFRTDMFTDDDKKGFEDPVYYKQFRRNMESELNVGHLISFCTLTLQGLNYLTVHPYVDAERVEDAGSWTRRFQGQHVEEAGKETMDRRTSLVLLIFSYEMCNQSLLVIPDFPVACRRLTPGPGYLEALCEDNVRQYISRLLKEIYLPYSSFRSNSFRSQSDASYPQELNQLMGIPMKWMSLYVQLVRSFLL